MSEYGEVEPIAVIGMAVRVPGAATYREYWDNILGRVESVTWFEPEALRQAGVPERLLADPDYVPAAGAIADADRFDAGFFGFSPAEAAMLDPQHRLFLEGAWNALEDAGHDPRRFEGAIGVYAGCFMNKYLPLNLYTNQQFLSSPAAYFARNLNDKDFLAGRAAYLMDLRGPAMTVQTACSTSLVATHLACQALLGYECDMALAGGVALNLPLKSGYLALEGTMFSPDGRCRPFDRNARGTLPGNGAALVVLRRLSDALADGDDVRAVIRGTAVNNDGVRKVSFTAPNALAQTRVISAAQAVSDVRAETIGYVEAHGTGTLLGDPIEIAALTDAFRAHTERRGFCALGSVKANIGHLDAAAGVAGLIRAALALQHRTIPPQANFTAPNPQLDLERSPFFVPETATDWPDGNAPRRAAVSSFGVGGTNAHAVLEEAPTRAAPAADETARQLIVVSARSQRALDQAAANLADHLEARPGLDAADAAFTLAAGRSEFDVRRFVVADGGADAARALRSAAATGSGAEPGNRQVVFMFPGVGTQYEDMGLDIYDAEPRFREQVDACADLLGDRLGMDVRQYLFPSRFSGPPHDRESVPNALAAIFTLEYALAELWMSWGVRPTALLGHSLGEYVAACLSGVLSLPDALDLTVRRGEIFHEIPDGRMMSVALSEADLAPLLGESLSLGAVNAPGLSMVSGRLADIEALAEVLEGRDVQHRKLPIRMASHSYLVEPFLERFAETVAGYTLSPPRLPYLSCVTGDWITAEQATDPAYWARQLRAPVRFAAMLGEAASESGRVFLEVGPGTTLTTLCAAQNLSPPCPAVPSLRNPRDPRSDHECLLTAVGRLWQMGVTPDWHAFYGEGRRRVPLPTYPFQRRRHWIEPGWAAGPASTGIVADPALAAGREEEEPIDSAEDAAAEDQRPDAPRSDRERAIAAVWRSLLGVSRVGVNDDFVALGGDSLLAAQVLSRIRPLCTATLTIPDMFEAPTIGQMAALMSDREATARRPAQRPEIKLAADVVLAPEIRADGLGNVPTGSPDAVFLTGATGFLGQYLLSELLQNSSAVVHCLVRADTAADGERRLRERLARCRLPIPEPGRLVAVPGDLERPRFGLSDAEFDALAEHSGAVYHCGAWVNFSRPYSVLKAANVGGTETVLRLASHRRLKAVHHISTIFVTMGAIVAGVASIDEDDPLPPAVGHDTGYTESKWVAEGLCRLARDRGIPVTIYRPGNILSARGTGVTNGEDYLTKVIQGCIQLGLAPRRHYPLPVGTVDDVAQAIVRQSTLAEAANKTFHMIQPEPLMWDRLFDAARACGYDVAAASWPDWCAALSRQIERGEDNALAPLADMLNAPEDRTMPHFGIENARRARSTLGLAYPTLDDDYFAAVFDYYVRAGWLPAAALHTEKQKTTAC